MATERFFGKQWLAELGYPRVVANPMESEIERWWGWYTSTCDFYNSDSTDGTKNFKVRRISIKPAKMVCEDWASLLFNERTEIGIAGESKGEEAALAQADEWLKSWLERNRFMRVANRTVERAMALGTAAWALRIDGLSVDGVISPEADIVPQRFDARHIVPLAWDGEACTACLFRSQAVIDGREVTQLQVYRQGDSGTWEIHTAFFDKAGRRVEAEGFAAFFDTGIATAPFALVRPGIDNAYLEFHPFGVSVFDSALGAVEMVDMAVDNLNKDIYFGQKMTFIPDSMLKKDENNNVTIPRAADQQCFVAFEGGEAYLGGEAGKPYEYNPDMRVADNRAAIRTALELLGKRSGFGKDYYTLDERGGGMMRNKTATEVASDTVELMRNIRKHEESITPAIEAVCEAAVALASRVCGQQLPDVTGKVSIVYGDSIIEDDAAVRARDREDVAAGLLTGWEYIQKWQAVDEETAKARWAEAQGPVSEA